MLSCPAFDDVDQPTSHHQVEVLLCLIDEHYSGASHMTGNPHNQLHELPLTTTQLIDTMSCPLHLHWNMQILPVYRY